MKKSILTTLCIVSTLLFISGCSKDENCTWGNSILDGKSFKVTKIVQVSNGTDVTASIFSTTPCSQNKLVFSGSTYSEVTAAGCSSGGSGTWSTNSTSGVNYLNVSGTNYAIPSFDCNSFTMTGPYMGTSSLVNVTLTKQ